jgi:hypothetical protein
MANPREHIRAAQAAELRGDLAGAIAELWKAAALYRRAGSLARAIQLLSHARTLDPSRVDVAEEVSRLERLPTPALTRALHGDDLEAGEPVEDSSAGAEAGDEVQSGPVEEPRDARHRPVEIQDASRRALDWAFQQAQEEEMASRDREEPRAEERALIERGPTRADPAIDAWCSFCCRPRVEVGELVAGPTGSFICAACVAESRGLLNLGDTEATRPRTARRKDEPAEGLELIGQAEARALLERALQAGARRLLVMGPEGTGKTVWLRELSRQERGNLVTLEVLEQGAGGHVALLEDVDRLSPEASARLASFLARYPERTVIMSARGALGAPSLVLRGAEGSLPVFTTRALSLAVSGGVPVALLEHVQLALALRVPTEAEFVEIARRLLAPRASELDVSEDVLAALASEVARSPRAGHELSALLARVLAGSWRLAGREKVARGKGAAKKPARRGRRKGPA